ncbi:hypothetical protein HHK36_015197 [Tetracentron sinense]|uniref:SAM domain-containing protein n=1 Tax=Tetracentron sinense TaxID=13715 RepID=A0A835DFY5_TETSI|nr:hypothetical protein HHK36_015197 [Tetracentron sinense]
MVKEGQFGPSAVSLSALSPFTSFELVVFGGVLDNLDGNEFALLVVHSLLLLANLLKVVKRARPISDGARSDSLPSSGNKRSIRERLGINGDSSVLYGAQPKNKRRRGDNSTYNPSNNGADDARIGPDDLRLKLTRKNISRRIRSNGEEQNNMDLREKISRTVQPPMSINTRHRMPEPKLTGYRRRIPPTRSADDLLQMDSLRKSYSDWTLDGLRGRSPGRILGTSRGLSPQRNMDELRQFPSIRPIDASRPDPYMRRDVHVLNSSRPTGPTHFMMKSTVPLEAAKPVTRLPPPSGIIQKSSYMGEEPHTVASLLHSLGLGKYAINFQAEEVDMTALKQMGDKDLKELGIPMLENRAYRALPSPGWTAEEDSPCNLASFKTATMITMT